jgi:hypothetical protein
LLYDTETDDPIHNVNTAVGSMQPIILTDAKLRKAGGCSTAIGCANANRAAANHYPATRADENISANRDALV